MTALLIAISIYTLVVETVRTHILCPGKTSRDWFLELGNSLPYMSTKCFLLMNKPKMTLVPSTVTNILIHKTEVCQIKNIGNTQKKKKKKLNILMKHRNLEWKQWIHWKRSIFFLNQKMINKINEKASTPFGKILIKKNWLLQTKKI